MSGLHRIAALGLWGLLVVVVATAVGGGATAGERSHRAGLVLVGEDGTMRHQCVEFDEDDISGVELLRRSGLSVVFSSSGAFGEAVCSLDGTGCNDPNDCFCQCRGADCTYWAYFSVRDDAWSFQAIGPSQRRVRDGDIDGWVWGGGRVPPDDIAFDEVCPFANAAPTSTSAPPTRVPADTPPDVAQQPTAPRSAATEPAFDPPTEAAATQTPVAAAPLTTLEEERVLTRPDDEAPSPPRGDLGTGDDDGGGAPAGLIAFGVVAGALVLGVGGFIVRRRLVG